MEVYALCSFLVPGLTRHPCPVWRILVGLSLVPAFATLYQRLTLPESVRFQAAKKGADLEADSIDELKKKADADPGVQENVQPVDPAVSPSATVSSVSAPADAAKGKPLGQPKSAYFRGASRR